MYTLTLRQYEIKFKIESSLKPTDDVALRLNFYIFALQTLQSPSEKLSFNLKKTWSLK